MKLPAFDIRPYVGALPIKFGTEKTAIPALLGFPPKINKSDTDLFSSVRIAYYNTGRVVEIGFAPRDITLCFEGTPIWSDERILDPIPLFLRQDENPVEIFGFLVFLKLGITCTGFHDDDEGQRAITVFQRGHWDKMISDAKQPDLSRYQK